VGAGDLYLIVGPGGDRERHHRASACVSTSSSDFSVKVSFIKQQAHYSWSGLQGAISLDEVLKMSYRVGKLSLCHPLRVHLGLFHCTWWYRNSPTYWLYTFCLPLLTILTRNRKIGAVKVPGETVQRFGDLHWEGRAPHGYLGHISGWRRWLAVETLVRCVSSTYQCN